MRSVAVLWKSRRTPRVWHRVQVGTYFLLIEEEFKVRPPHGVIVCGDSSQYEVESTAELRAFVLQVAAQIRGARANVTTSIPVNLVRGQCRLCGMRGHCGQARFD